MTPTFNSFQRYALKAMNSAGIPCETFGNWVIRLDTMTEIMSDEGVEVAVANRPKIVESGYDTSGLIDYSYWTFEACVTVYEVVVPDSCDGYHARADDKAFFGNDKSYEVGHEFIPE